MGFYDAIRIGASGAAKGYEVERSLRFNDDDSPYLSRTPSSAGNRRTYTISVWAKIIDNGTYRAIIGAGGGTSRDRLQIFNDDKLVFNLNDGSGGDLRTTQLLRDPNAWYHIVVGVDTTQSTASDRIKLYLNGSQVTSFSTENYPSQNYDCNLNNNIETFIGQSSSNNFYFEGYLAEFNFIDGSQLTPSSFGATDALTGQWNPKKYGGGYGTNGFYLNFANNDLFTFFADSSSAARTVTRNGNVIHKSDQTKNGATSIYFDGSGDTLTVPDSSDFTVGSGDFTIEAYIRRTSQGNDEWFFVQSTGTTASTSIGLHIGSSSSGYANKPSFRYTEGSTGNELNGTTTLATNTWYHIAGVRQSNTVRIYVNGVQENSASYSGTINDSSAPVVMGAVTAGGSAGFTGHMDQLRWSNSVRYPDGTSFTAPTTQFTADSNTKLLVQSNVTGDIGSDSSGNGNNFTPNNFSVAAGTGNDSLEDTPTNNFSTINPLAGYSTTFEVPSNGNLDFSLASSEFAFSSFEIPLSGKWYAEILFTTFASGRCGITNLATKNANKWHGIDHMGGAIRVDDSQVQSGLSPTIGDNKIVGIKVDRDAGTIAFTVDGSDSGTAVNISSMTAPENLVFAVGRNSSSGSAPAGSMNFGQRPFSYLPTGYQSLCSANLPDPSIAKPNKHFETRAYTGTGAGNTQTLTGFEFAPDLVWGKNRTSAYNPGIFDTVREATNRLWPNLTNAEASNNAITAFTSDGYTVGTDAFNTNSQVTWNWKAGGSSTSSNSDGSITSSVSVNVSAGFSIVTFSGSGNRTIGHGLGVAPQVIIMKGRNVTDQWTVGHQGLDASNPWHKGIPLNTSASTQDNSGFWNDTAPTSTVFSKGTWNDGYNMVAYCFSEVKNYSKFGSYRGNQNTKGSFIYTGFEPALVITKGTWGGNWNMYDNSRNPYNVANKTLYPNLSNAESTENSSGNQMDLLSNGFKLRGSNNDTNHAADFIYLAFAESPFKYARAR